MKKLMSFFIAIVAACLLLTVGIKRLESAQGDSSAKTLNLFNWGDYIDPALIKKFEKETGYQVNYETFDSNEAMLTKIQQGGTSYDLAVPSDYTIEKMKKEHLLLPLDKKQIKGLGNIDPSFMNKSFDPDNRYSIPYFWGTLGIIYNDKFVKADQIQHWRDLWNPEFAHSIMLVDSARDILGFSLVKNGDSMNTRSRAQVTRAKDDLDKLAPNVKAIVADEIKMYMIQNEEKIAVTWSGEASEMLSNNSHLHYVVPTEGSNLWFDNLVIPKTAKHFKAIYAFLNFMLRPENAKQNALYVGYATPNDKAKALLPKDVRNDKQFYPPTDIIGKLQVYEDLGLKTVGMYNDLFLEFKMHRS
ncbi:MAG: ABC transporter substrate-binding protein [Schleiferilactobacillus harbinensis]|jgi:spermidine/putrescine transport system substrate-binding protein|nr:ABC transporter substrate-binding protein [Schleiferilactobacillus harbinensis]